MDDMQAGMEPSELTKKIEESIRKARAIKPDMSSEEEEKLRANLQETYGQQEPSISSQDDLIQDPMDLVGPMELKGLAMGGKALATKGFPMLMGSLGRTGFKKAAEIGERELAETAMKKGAQEAEEMATKKLVRSGPPKWGEKAVEEVPLKDKLAEISKKQINPGGQKSSIPNWEKYGEDLAKQEQEVMREKLLKQHPPMSETIDELTPKYPEGAYNEVDKYLGLKKLLGGR